MAAKRGLRTGVDDLWRKRSRIKTGTSWRCHPRATFVGCGGERGTSTPSAVNARGRSAGGSTRRGGSTQ